MAFLAGTSRARGMACLHEFPHRRLARTRAVSRGLSAVIGRCTGTLRSSAHCTSVLIGEATLVGQAFFVIRAAIVAVKANPCLPLLTAATISFAIACDKRGVLREDAIIAHAKTILVAARRSLLVRGLCRSIPLESVAILHTDFLVLPRFPLLLPVLLLFLSLLLSFLFLL